MRTPQRLTIDIGILILAACMPIAWAQQNGPGGQTGNGNTGNTSSRDLPRPVTAPTPQQGNQIPNQRLQQLVFLSGNVIQEDGSPAPFGAVIELDCVGSVTKEATVTNGRFSFQVGSDIRSGEVIPDASQRMEPLYSDIDPVTRMASSSGMTGDMESSRRKRLMGCDVRVQLAGYRSTSLYLKTEPFPGPNEVGTIVVYPIERVQGSSISYTSLMAPKSARKSASQARKAVHKKNLPEAETLLKAAVHEYPKYAEAWLALGQVYEDQNRKLDAQEAYRQAVVADKAYVKPYMQLAYMALKEKQWKESLDLSRSVLALDPVTLPEAYYINALANLNLSELDLAEESARHGQRLDMMNQFPQFHLILANVFANRDDTANSIRELKTYLRVAPNSSNAGLVRSRLRELEAQAKEQQAKNGG